MIKARIFNVGERENTYRHTAPPMRINGTITKKKMPISRPPFELPPLCASMLTEQPEEQRNVEADY